MNRIVRLRWGLVVLAGILVANVAFIAVARASDKGDAKKLYEEATAAFALGRYAEAAEKYEGAFALKLDPALLYNAAQSYRLAGNKARALELYRNYLRLYPDPSNTVRNQVAALTKALEDERGPSGMAKPGTVPLVGTPAPPPAARPSTAPPPAARPSTAPAPPPAARPSTAPVAQPQVAPLPVAPVAAPRPMPAPVATAPATTAPPAMPPPVLAAPQPPVTPVPAPGADVTVARTAAPAGGQSGSHTWLWVAGGAAVVLIGTIAIVAATRGGDKFHDPTLGSVNGN